MYKWNLLKVLAEIAKEVDRVGSVPMQRIKDSVNRAVVRLYKQSFSLPEYCNSVPGEEAKVCL